MTCDHTEFAGGIKVTRLTDDDRTKIVTGYTADVTIECAACRLPFRFIGLPFGSSPANPTVSADGTELRAPIEPAYVTEILGRPIVGGTNHDAG